MTLVLGGVPAGQGDQFGLLADAAISVVPVFALTVREYLIVHNVMATERWALSLWTFLYGQRAKRRGEARRASMAAAQGTPDEAAAGACRPMRPQSLSR